MVLGYDEFVNKIMLYIGAIEKKQHKKRLNLRTWEILRNPRLVRKTDFYLVETII